MFQLPLSRFAHVRNGILLLTLAPLTLANTSNPNGTITTDRNVVLANSVVNVNWKANFPKPILNIVDRPTPPTITLTPKVRLRADVRVIGAAFGPNSNPYPVCGWVKTSVNSGWTQIFLGNNNTFNPQTIVWSKILAVDEKLDFRFQGAVDGSYNRSNFTGIDNWQPMIDTTSSSPNPWNRMVFVDDETVPNFNPAFDQGDVHAHLAAYFEPGTTRLKLGENDFIYLTELSNFAQGNTSTDMQDLVLLVTFTQVTTP